MSHGLCDLTLADEENAQVHSVLADARLQRLLTISEEINALRSKINIATKYIGSASTTGETEEVVLAREVLRRDLERDFHEARKLMPIVDELVSKSEEQIRSLEERKKVREGLAKIEGLSGATKRERAPRAELDAAASKDKGQISELESFIGALDNLEKDLSLTREVVTCPRCYSHEISYRIATSEMGFSLYRCNRCENTWQTRWFSMRIGSPAQLGLTTSAFDLACLPLPEVHVSHEDASVLRAPMGRLGLERNQPQGHLVAAVHFAPVSGDQPL